VHCLNDAHDLLSIATPHPQLLSCYLVFYRTTSFAASLLKRSSIASSSIPYCTMLYAFETHEQGRMRCNFGMVQDEIKEQGMLEHMQPNAYC
jgi:hypothetical protein